MARRDADLPVARQRHPRSADEPPNRREIRILFFLTGDTVVLVHGFVKKSQKTPKPDLDLALSRKAEFERNEKALAKPRPKTT